MSTPAPDQHSPRRRWSLLLLLVPVALFVLTPVVANTVQPRILGMPFMLAYIIGATIATWLFVWLAARFDHRYRGNEAEYVPVDHAFHGVHHTGEEELS
ncbi:DUF3311 domain-containing protein [Brevibacterium sp. 5221]|uniref:DUF3311 domain-containing protein n=1 Tax=Brevibacterium rongguiense TaxID=2695267 RepID=A0A6N9H8T0_9MICO|nr:DUF3311 domain-containing protein [Brevibacterium rongguiense]MYM20437.1 DUF3311 domain-containing protein [Brevibacterium rongguiense]